MIDLLWWPNLGSPTHYHHILSRQNVNFFNMNLCFKHRHILSRGQLSSNGKNDIKDVAIVIERALYLIDVVGPGLFNQMCSRRRAGHFDFFRFLFTFKVEDLWIFSSIFTGQVSPLLAHAGCNENCRIPYRRP